MPNTNTNRRYSVGAMIFHWTIAVAVAELEDRGGRASR